MLCRSWFFKYFKSLCRHVLYFCFSCNGLCALIGGRNGHIKEHIIIIILIIIIIIIIIIIVCGSESFVYNMLQGSSPAATTGLYVVL